MNWSLPHFGSLHSEVKTTVLSRACSKDLIFFYIFLIHLFIFFPLPLKNHLPVLKQLPMSSLHSFYKKPFINSSIPLIKDPKSMFPIKQKMPLVVFPIALPMTMATPIALLKITIIRRLIFEDHISSSLRQPIDELPLVSVTIGILFFPVAML